MLRWFSKELNRLQEVKRDERGFTLIELLVVVIIIGILAAIAVPIFLSQRDSAEDNAARAQLRNAATAQASIYADTGSFSSVVADLEDFGFPTSGDPAVTIVTPATGTGPAFCMSAPGSGTNTYVVKDTATTPATGTC